MEITQGSLAAMFQGLKATFLAAVHEAGKPVLDGLVHEEPSSTHEELYPVLSYLGDLEQIFDEYPTTNIAEWLHAVENETFGRVIKIPRNRIADDQVGMYMPQIKRLAAKAATFRFRMAPYLFVSSDGTATGGAGGGFQLAWIDGANVFANAHVWPGDQTWDNLDSLPLTQGNFETVVMHLEQRIGPDGRPMDLAATHLIVGPTNHINARNIVRRALVAGGNSNIHYDEVQVVKWSAIRDESWFVADLSPEQPEPVLIQNRELPEFTAQDNPTDEDAFKRDVFNYKVRERHGSAIMCPWVIQAVNWDAETMTTTTQAA